MFNLGVSELIVAITFFKTHWFSMCMLGLTVASTIYGRGSRKAAKRSADAAEQANEDNRLMNQQAGRPWIGVVTPQAKESSSNVNITTNIQVTIVFNLKNFGRNPLGNLKTDIFIFKNDLTYLTEFNSKTVNPLLPEGISGQEIFIDVEGGKEFFICIYFSYKDLIHEKEYTQPAFYYKYWQGKIMLLDEKRAQALQIAVNQRK